MAKNAVIAGSWFTDQGGGWLQVDNDSVRAVGALGGYSDQTRMSLSHSYFAEGADAERFERAAEDRGFDLIQSPQVTHEGVSRVRFMGRFQPALIERPLAQGMDVNLAGGRSGTIAGMDRDQLTNQDVVLVDVQTPEGVKRGFFPGSQAAQAVRAPAPEMRMDRRMDVEAPRRP